MKIDTGLMARVEQAKTGANVHRIANLQQTYMDACYLNRVKQAEQAKHELYVLLRKVAWFHGFSET